MRPLSWWLLILIGLANLVQADTRVELQTSEGNILLELDTHNAPETTANFLHYVNTGHYDGTLFHRVIADFMIQGGGFDQQGKRKQTGKPIHNESHNGLKNQRGTIAMARHPEPHSATAQFFINTIDNPDLDAQGERYGYAVFGRVVKGMEVVDLISAFPVMQGQLGGRAAQNIPAIPVIIKKAVVQAETRSTTAPNLQETP